MWKSPEYYEVPAEVRKTYSDRIEFSFKRRGLTFNVTDETCPHTPYKTTACLNYNRFTQAYTFYCGEFWYEEENILPVVAMAHELGHYLDVKDNFELNMERYIRELGTLELETRAWLIAIEICEEIGFTEWDVFLQYAKNCLVSYFNSPIIFNDMRYGFRGEKPTFEAAVERLEERIAENALV